MQEGKDWLEFKPQLFPGLRAQALAWAITSAQICDLRQGHSQTRAHFAIYKMNLMVLHNAG